MAKISPENTEEAALRHIMTPLLRADLDRALESLSERRREIFLAHFLDGVTYFDLSIQYAVPEKRISAIIRITRSQLQNVTSLRKYLDMLP